MSKLEEGGDVRNTTGQSYEDKFNQMESEDEEATASQSATIDDPNTPKYVCGYCGLMFCLQRDYLHHLNVEHGCDSTRATSESLDSKLELGDSNISNLLIKREEIKHEILPLPIDSKDWNMVEGEPVANTRLNISTHGKTNQYKCDVCGMEFSHDSSLRMHAVTHTGDKPYKCDICGKGFTSASNLKSHKTVHTGEKLYKCDICGKEFAHSTTLKVHVRRHTGEKPYKCDVCGRAFSHSTTLKLHVRTHTGEKPYKCEICGKSFPRNNLLKLHVKNTHTKDKTM